MISRATTFSKRSILHQIACKNQKLEKIPFKLGPRSQISESVLASMGYSSQAGKLFPVVQYPEIKDLSNHPEKLLIDVREPQEIQETGKIPTSINIPVGSIRSMLSDTCDCEYFQRRFGRKKPDFKACIIMSCHSGDRSDEAARQAQSIGYTNVQVYKGSWLDWAKRESLRKRVS